MSTQISYIIRFAVAFSGFQRIRPACSLY